MPTARTGRVETYFEDTGSGQPLLWLQGLGADHRAWAAQVARFGSEYRCIAPDSRDVGRSSRVEEAYILADVAADAAALLAAVDAAPAHVVGLSLGGAVAQHLALDYPELVRSLCLVSTFAYQDPRHRELLLAWREIYARVDALTFYRQANTWLFSDRFFERPRNAENALRYIASGSRQEPEAFARQIDAALLHDTRARMPTLNVPTLVVSGELDILAPPHLGRELARLIPGARFELMRGAAHSLNLERQIEFNRLLGSFLRGVAP